MKLYYSKGACSLGVRITINEMGLASEYESVDLKTKKTASGEDYLKINPKGAVPVLELNSGDRLTENVAIQIYLADTYKAYTLLPQLGNLSRYRVIEWLAFVSSDIHKSFGPLFNPKFPEADKKEFFIPLLQNKFNFIEHHLKENEYLMGEEYTLPDSYLFVMISWLHHFKIDLTPNLARYFNELIKRPAIQKSLKEENLSFNGSK